MIFASLVFLFGFLPLFLLGYYAAPRRWRNAWLTIASYAFYGWWRVDFLWLMLLSTVVDFAAGRRIAATAAPAARRAWLLLSLVVNLGLLGWFKYANLVVETGEELLGVDWAWERVILPIGISFYTFQSMSYTIDVYARRVQPVRSFVDFACFVSMFPQLIAGPIVRFRDVETQLRVRAHGYGRFAAGAALFVIGFDKKVLIADNVAPLADAVFAAAAPGLADAWLGVLAYAVQIYFDFSGYSDMAIGLGAMIGFELPRNFDSPYRAESITDFWRRWHMTLSSWLRDYLYVPLGGNRRGRARCYVNLAATMLLGGLWHGAAWTFVLWGAYQGAFLVLERALGKRPAYAGLPRPLRIALTFVIVLGGWAVFRAPDVTTLGGIAAGMAGIGGAGALPAVGEAAWIALAAGLAIAFCAPRADLVVTRDRPWVGWLTMLLFCWAVAQLAAGSYSPFIYFQF